MELTLVILIILSFISVALMLTSDKEWCSLIGAIIAICSSVGIIYIGFSCRLENKPQALDVYQGKTTLQITYQDSIPVDSVVVFKK